MLGFAGAEDMSLCFKHGLCLVNILSHIHRSLHQSENATLHIFMYEHMHWFVFLCIQQVSCVWYPLCRHYVQRLQHIVANVCVMK